MPEAAQSAQERLPGAAACLGIPEPSRALYGALNALREHPAIRRFTVPGKPVVWKRPEWNGKTKRRYTHASVRKHSGEVQLAYTAARLEPIEEGPVGILLRFVFEHDDSHFNAAGQLKPQWIGTRPGHNKGDGDNLAKLVKDALNKRAYTDDAQIAETVEIRDWAGDGERAHTEIVFWPL